MSVGQFFVVFVRERGCRCESSLSCLSLRQARHHRLLIRFGLDHLKLWNLGRVEFGAAMGHWHGWNSSAQDWRHQIRNLLSVLIDFNGVLGVELRDTVHQIIRRALFKRLGPKRGEVAKFMQRLLLVTVWLHSQGLEDVAFDAAVLLQFEVESFQLRASVCCLVHDVVGRTRVLLNPLLVRLDPKAKDIFWELSWLLDEFMLRLVCRRARSLLSNLDLLVEKSGLLRCPNGILGMLLLAEPQIRHEVSCVELVATSLEDLEVLD